MSAFRAFMEIQMISAVKLIETIENIFASMGMNNIEKDSEAHTMRCVDEFFELFRGAIAGARGEEACNLVPESYKLVSIIHEETTQSIQA